MNTSQLYKYLSGECTEREKEAVEYWIRQDPQNEEALNLVRQIWEVEPRDEFRPDIRDGFRRVQQQIGRSDANIEDQQHSLAVKVMGKKYLHKRWNGIFIAAAAIITLLVTVLVVIQYLAIHPGNTSHTKLQALTTQKGERATYRLPDGTEVVLNAESTLQLSPAFASGVREGYLRGEAYFDVAPNTDRLFIIYSKNTFTRVLGTKFAITAYSDIQGVRAVVEEGRVLFGLSADFARPSASLALGSKELAKIQSGGIKHIRLKNSLARYLGWKEGKMVFVKAPLQQMIPRLERWYNISITLADSALGSRRMTASFDSESLSEVLDIISLSLDVTYSQAHKQIVFKDLSVISNSGT